MISSYNAFLSGIIGINLMIERMKDGKRGGRDRGGGWRNPENNCPGIPRFFASVALPAGMADAGAATVLTDVPARLDRLGWSRFHTLIVVALGITWILDGLEVTLVGSVAGVLTQRGSLGLAGTQVGLVGSAYIAGAVLGALVFGDLTDRFGRRTLFMVTLGVYMAATIATGAAWNFWSFALFRFFTGAGIGGEYAAINSAIQEFVPARFRGRTDLVVNGSFWIGAAIGAFGVTILLDPALLPADVGWRCAFGIGALLGLPILLLR